MKHVVITGTSRGIGLELVKIFAEKGDQVIAISRNIQQVEALQLKNVIPFACDLTNSEDLEKLTSYLQKKGQNVDVLINNAGTIVNKPFSETSTEEFKNVFNTNVFAVAALTKSMLPFMNKGSHVVNISSMGGIQGSAKFAGLSAYSSSKGALITLTELLAEEFKETGPVVNALALGAVQTEMLQEAFPGYEAPVSAKEMAVYIADFSLNGYKYFNGKVLQVANSTP